MWQDAQAIKALLRRVEADQRKMDQSAAQKMDSTKDAQANANITNTFSLNSSDISRTFISGHGSSGMPSSIGLETNIEATLDSFNSRY